MDSSESSFRRDLCRIQRSHASSNTLRCIGFPFAYAVSQLQNWMLPRERGVVAVLQRSLDQIGASAAADGDRGFTD